MKGEDERRRGRLAVAIDRRKQPRITDVVADLIGVPVTARQRRLLRLICDCYARGAPATYREMMLEMDAKSTNSVTCHLAALVRRQLITIDVSTARGVRPVGARLAIEYARDAAGERLRRAVEGEAK